MPDRYDIGRDRATKASTTPAIQQSTSTAEPCPPRPDPAAHAFR